MASMEAANARYHNGHQQQQIGGPPLPASPTLTNPDMILPDEIDQSYSPEKDLNGRGHSPLGMWKGTHAAAISADMQHIFSTTNSGGSTGGLSYGLNAPATPTTPIIYGNGTMLSDIGEVTEVESTPGKPSPTRNKGRRATSLTRRTGLDATLRSSPTIGATSAMQKSKQIAAVTRERRASMESTSTITTENQAGLFADFDDSASVEDSVFQGDDEESTASSYHEGRLAVDPDRLGVTRMTSMDRLSTYSTSSLSRRAEEILANAKQRLTTMESNLTRARSSLHNNAYGSDGSTPSPPFQRAATVAQPRDAATIIASGAAAISNQASSGHTRISSDIAMRNGLPYRVAVPRSQSAMGVSGGYRQPLVMSRSADQIREEIDDEHGRPTYNIPPAKKPGPHALTEDEVAQLEGPDNESRSARIEEFLSPTSGSFSSNESRRNSLLRSTSSAQMRDIKDQMKDLKGKISTLREQARADNLKRRSLQSLRTPSPFTYSQMDQWYTEPPSNRNSIALTGSVSGRNPWNGEESDLDGDVKDNAQVSLRGSHLDDVTSISHGIQAQGELDLDDYRALETDDPMHTAREEVSPDDDDVSDMLTENGDVDDEQLEDEFQDADEDIKSESGESLYHDSVQHQISHEDREDAFDYEHFFLHSAMGTMSRQKLERRGSVDSYTSEDSVETTRGPTRTDDYSDSPSKSLSPMSRRNSRDSVSTVDTFATAEEARSRKSPITPEMGYGSDGTFPGFSRISISPDRNRSRSVNSVRTKKSSFSAGSSHHASGSGATHPHMAGDSDASISSIPEEGSEGAAHQTPRQPTLRRPTSVSAFSSLHRPSVASLDSQGTNRSFPLVPSSKTKRASSSGMLTPSDSPDHELKSLSESLMSETASVYEQAKAGGESSIGPRARAASAASTFTAGGLGPPREKAKPLQELLREDKFLVERLVANLGKCVLGLTENGRASMESRQFRRRIEAANRILEGLGEPPE
ncbi:uncharacterized protein QC761_116770 [Podospora bellae-mahoneyi]|uniref:Cep57 centrosome microtubule-binding domain-containing protein n=1 Tax=Podospora bellae-mahoneyi TaxID=2093777 RepID=A0ABR0G0E1_9PEZI|nr:hypothetical protein QC761_116770 [Podospora bellae-mahoneyi]